MQRKTVSQSQSDYLYVQAEARTNMFNLKCFLVMCVMAILSLVLNEIGLFRVDRVIMIPATVSAVVFYAFPGAVVLIHDVILKKENKFVENPKFKNLIIASSFLGTTFIATVLAFHVAILTVVPALLALSYRLSKRGVSIITILTLVMVPVTVYGSFFFGALDRNFIKGMMTEEEFMVLSNRLSFIGTGRMLELLYHYTLPRLLCAIAVLVVGIGINDRNRRLLEQQAEMNRKINEEMQKSNELQSHVINVLATLIETRDVSTGEHVMRTQQYVHMIATEMSKHDKYRDILTPEEISKYVRAAPLHDVGKISVSDTVLLKPGRLSTDEFEVMKTHAAKGGKIIQSIFADMEDQELLQVAEKIAVAHHEKWDGTGYPKGLRGEEIPLCARIMAVADVYDALVSVRVYKPAVSPEKAFDIMMSKSGTHFDPDIMKIVFSIKDELIKAAESPVKDN